MSAGSVFAFIGGQVNTVFLGAGQDIAIAFSSNLNFVLGQGESDIILGAGVGNLFSGGAANDLLFGFGRKEESDNDGEGEGEGGGTDPVLDVPGQRRDGLPDADGPAVQHSERRLFDPYPVEPDHHDDADRCGRRGIREYGERDLRRVDAVLRCGAATRTWAEGNPLM